MSTINNYTNNKRNYLNLVKQSRQSNQSNQSYLLTGGNNTNKESSDKMIKGLLTTFMLTTAYTKASPVKLSDLVKDIKIKKIGSFNVKSKVVIGDTDYEILDLKSGKYTAYALADSLMIIHDDLNIKPDAKNVGEWVWNDSEKGVGVDTGMFGFFDLDVIKKINGDNTKNYNNLPIFEEPSDNEFDAFLVDGSNIEESDKKENPSLNDLEPFGVISSTGTGDGGFKCFVINNDRAILIGGEADQALNGVE
jgi:hypothetical protein